MYTRITKVILLTLAALIGIICNTSIYAADLGANLLTDASWEIPGNHYVPDGRTCIKYRMQVFSNSDLYVNAEDSRLNSFSGGSEPVPSVWKTYSVKSNLRGQLPVTGQIDEPFYLEGSQGERLTFTWSVQPAEGYEWPEAYRLLGIVKGVPDPLNPGSGHTAFPAVGAYFKIRDPHREYHDHVTIAGGFGVPRMFIGGGLDKEYHEDDYRLWIEEGDRISIHVPQEEDVNFNLSCSSPPLHEVWRIPADGIGDDTFHVVNPTSGYPQYSFPDDYIEGSGYDTLPASNGLSWGALCGEIFSLVHSH